MHKTCSPPVPEIIKTNQARSVIVQQLHPSCPNVGPGAEIRTKFGQCWLAKIRRLWPNVDRVLTTSHPIRQTSGRFRSTPLPIMANVWQWPGLTWQTWANLGRIQSNVGQHRPMIDWNWLEFVDCHQLLADVCRLSSFEATWERLLDNCGARRIRWDYFPRCVAINFRQRSANVCVLCHNRPLQGGRPYVL